MNLDPLWIFKGHCAGLSDAVDDGPGEYAHLRLAGQLRSLLIDSPSADAANRRFGLTLRYPVRRGAASAPFEASADGRVLFNSALLAGPPASDGATPSEFLDIKDFLALPAVRVSDGGTFTLLDAILAGANLAGAVHAAPRGTKAEDRLPLARALFGPGVETGSHILIATARHALAGLEHLRSLALGTSLYLAQPRDDHQPWIALDTRRERGVAVEFRGHEFFEDGLPSGLSPPFAWTVTVALRAPQPHSCPGDWRDERILLEAASVRDDGERFAIVQRGTALCARLGSPGADSIETAPIALPARRFAAVAAGLEADTANGWRVFLRVRDPQGWREATGGAHRPPAAAVWDGPGRYTLGCGARKGAARAGQGALAQLLEATLLLTSERAKVDVVLADAWKAWGGQSWVRHAAGEGRVTRFLNQAATVPAGRVS